MKTAIKPGANASAHKRNGHATASRLAHLLAPSVTGPDADKIEAKPSKKETPPLEAVADGDQSADLAPVPVPSPGGTSNGATELNSGRGSGGRFMAGNKIARGNPFARRQAALRTALMEAVNEDRLRRIAGKLADLAETGDVPAAKLLLSYVVGRPAEAPDPDGVDANEWRRLWEMPEWPDVTTLLCMRIPLARAIAAVNEKADLMAKWFAEHLAAVPGMQREGESKPENDVEGRAKEAPPEFAPGAFWQGESEREIQ